jgi:hypothetical protein
MSAADAARQPLRPSAKALGLASVLVLLFAVAGYGALHEWRKASLAPGAPAAASGHAFAEQRPALSAAEERFAQALWSTHTDVRTAAVRMTFAGLAYKMGDGGRADVQRKVAPLVESFRAAETQLRGLDAPPSMHTTRERYAAALQVYARAATEMVKVADDGDDAHLLQAQEMSEAASGVLLEVGDQLWPGEIKPN